MDNVSRRKAEIKSKLFKIGTNKTIKKKENNMAKVTAEDERKKSWRDYMQTESEKTPPRTETRIIDRCNVQGCIREKAPRICGNCPYPKTCVEHLNYVNQ